jgi:hypothetical protein
LSCGNRVFLCKPIFSWKGADLFSCRCRFLGVGVPVFKGGRVLLDRGRVPFLCRPNIVGGPSSLGGADLSCPGHFLVGKIVSLLDSILWRVWRLYWETVLWIYNSHYSLHSHLYFQPTILSIISVILIRSVRGFADVFVHVGVIINLISLTIFLCCHCIIVLFVFLLLQIVCQMLYVMSQTV